MIEIGAGGGSIAGDRRGRPAARRPALRRRRSGPGLLRPRRHRADRDRRQPGARLLRSRLLPRRPHGARPRGAPSARWRRSATPLGLSAIEAALGHPQGRHREHGRGRAHPPRREGQGPARATRWSASAAPGPRTPRASRASSASREVIIPPASGAASALGFLAAPLSFELVRSHPVAPRAPASTRRRSTRSSTSSRREGRARADRGRRCADADVTVERTADMRLVGQMHEINVPLPAGAHRRREPRRDPRGLRRGLRRALHLALRRAPRSRRSASACACVGPDADARRSTRRAAAATGAASARARARPGSATASSRRRSTTATRSRPATASPGPAIIEEREATTVVPPGDSVTVDDEPQPAHRDRRRRRRRRRVVTPGMPLAEAMALIEADPIALEIMWSRLVTVVEEMWLTVCRTAFSLIISEAQDFACELLDPDGETLAHSPRAMPVFNLTLPRAVKALLAKYPARDAAAGRRAGHQRSVAVRRAPVRHRGASRRCSATAGWSALIGTVGHVSDIGGTKDSLRAREIYEEGFQIPPMKLYRGGRAERGPVRADRRERAQSRRRCWATSTPSSPPTRSAPSGCWPSWTNTACTICARSPRSCRAAPRRRCATRSARMPDGVYTSEIWNNPLGTPLRYPVEAHGAGRRDRGRFRRRAAAAAAGRAQLHAQLHRRARDLSAEMHAHARACAAMPAATGRSPSRRRRASILNCDKPAAVNLRTRTGWYIAPNIFRALAEAAPGAGAGRHRPAGRDQHLRPRRATARSIPTICSWAAGRAPRRQATASPALLWPTSAANTSIELFESARAGARAGEGLSSPIPAAPGRHRGGLGQRVRVRKLRRRRPADAGLGLPGRRRRRRCRGCSAACRAATCAAWCSMRDGNVVQDCGTGELVTLTRTDRIVEIQLAGGAGFGDPRTRSASQVEQDVAEGVVSPEAAARDYGLRIAAGKAAE